MLRFIHGVLQRGFNPDRSYGEPHLLDAQNDLRKGDYIQTRGLLGRLKRFSQREFAFYVLSDTGRAAGMLQALESWTHDYPGDPDSWILKGMFEVAWAWDARTGARASDVTEKGWKTFFERLQMAEQSLDRAIQLAPHDPQPYASSVIVQVGLERDERTAFRYFGKAIRRYPKHRSAHNGMLMYLQEKWHGSHEKMFQFARLRTSQCPAVAGIIAMSHIEKWFHLRAFQNDFQQADSYFGQPSVGMEIAKAYDQLIGSGKIGNESMYYLNNFAYCFWKMKDASRAKHAFELIEHRIDYLPWIYELMPSNAIKSARNFALKHG